MSRHTTARPAISPKSYDLSMDALEDEGPVRLAGGSAATANDWELAAAAVLRNARRIPDDAPAAACGRPLPEKRSRARHSAAGHPRAGRPPLRAGVRPATPRTPGPGGDHPRRIGLGHPLGRDATRTRCCRCLGDRGSGERGDVPVGHRRRLRTTPGELARVLGGVLLDIAPIVLTATGTSPTCRPTGVHRPAGARGTRPTPAAAWGPIRSAARSGQPQSWPAVQQRSSRRSVTSPPSQPLPVFAH